jgi:isocitrate dehydrogenase
MTAYQTIRIPEAGEKISNENGRLSVPDHPIIPFVEGDSTGRDIWRASMRVFDAAVEKAYAGERKIHWMEIFAGEKAYDRFGSWLPDETVQAFQEYLLGSKARLPHPSVGGSAL